MLSRTSSYFAVLSTEHAARTFGAALLGRLCYGVVFLSLILAVAQTTGSYAVAGWFSALYGLTTSILLPLRAKLIDRHGLRRILPPMVSIYALLLVVIAAVTWRTGASPVALLTLGVLAGAFTPPLGPIMRSLWTYIVADERLRQRAFALDTICEELLYVTGPLFAGLLAALVSPSLGVAVSAALVITGSLMLVTSPAVVFKPPSTETIGFEPNASNSPNAREASQQLIRDLNSVYPIFVSAAAGMCLGALSLLVVAFANRERDIAAVAWVEASLAVGSVVGGLTYGAITWRLSAGARLPLLTAALGVSLTVAGLSGNIVALAVMVGLAGLFVSPTLTTTYLLADHNASANAQVQAGAWVNSAYNLASSLGSAVIAVLISRFSLSTCFAITATPTIFVAILAIFRQSWRREKAA